MTDMNPNFSRMRPRRKRIFLFPLLFVAVAFLMGGAVMWLWNNILPEVAGVGMLNFWQALGLLALCRILFGGFRGGGGNWGKHRSFGGPQIRQRWMQMSDEERQRFKEEWRERCRRRER